MISDDVLQRAVYKIHACPELAGCIVGYWGDGVCRTIGYPYCVTPNSENVAVIIEEVALPPQTTVQPATAIAAPPPPQVKGALNSTKLWPELIGAGASCALFGVSAAGVVGGVAGEIPTDGAATLLIVASWVG